MERKLTFTFIGGDRRQLEAMYLLLEMGHKVNAFGFDKDVDGRVNLCTELEQQLFNCDVLLLPIPYGKNGKINIKLSKVSMDLAEIIVMLENTKPLIVMGKVDKEFSNLVLGKGIDYIDITSEESFAILNAIPTAEGAIQKAMEMTYITIHGSKTLVLGYGRIGKSLSRMLKGIGARVTVEARKDEDLAWIIENGYEAIHLKDLEAVLPSQDIIFNTIPHLILDREKLSKINRNTVIIDVSSYPGGIDFDAASELGIKASLDLGLPGIVAPKTAAEIICKVMLDALNKREISV